MAYRFTRTHSVYPLLPEDASAQVLHTDGLTPDEKGRFDVTDRLQRLIDTLKLRDNYGIVFVPQGEYTLTHTLYIPGAIRLIGVGETRPRFTLPAATPGFQIAEEGEPGTCMVWFTGNVPAKDGKINDANPGTFYSALSNIDFKVEDGNPAAIILRTHYAQHCFISHSVFETGCGLAAIYDAGNESENLTFLGGEYGILTHKCSPSWPFVLADSAFVGQRRAAVSAREGGLIFVRAEFRDVHCCEEVWDGLWEKLFWKDCVFENVSGPALKIARENSPNTQINLQNVWCRGVSQLLYGKESGKVLAAISGDTQVKSLTHGRVMQLGDKLPHAATALDAVPVTDFSPDIISDIPELPAQSGWVNVRTCGVYGDGLHDDTAALQAAVNAHDTLYFPQGQYLLSDTLKLRKGSSLIGLNPISTRLMIADNTPVFAGLGAPKALLETAEGGFALVNGLVLDTAARNPRAVGCKWMADETSYMNDVKFYGGHGSMAPGVGHMPVYNATRTADADPDRKWDSQYWSLWVTNNGGGTFKDLWTANTYAEAGMFLSESSTRGHMYQISLEHHVRHEALMRNLSNWSFFGIQTEEEVAESSYCQPYELSNCHDLTFANVYSFRVVWVDNPYPQVMKLWNCENLTMFNVHNYTQMKYTIENVLRDCNTNQTANYWELAKLTVGEQPQLNRLPEKTYEPQPLVSGLDAIDAMAEDSKGNLYVCDSRLKRIYKWEKATGRMSLLCDIHFRALSLAVDTQDHLLVLGEYAPQKHSVVDGVDENQRDELMLEAEKCGSSFFMYWSFGKRIRAWSLDPAAPEETLAPMPVVKFSDVLPETLYYPRNQWRDDGDMMQSDRFGETDCWLAPDGKTGVAHTPSISRGTGLMPLKIGQTAYLVDEYNKCIVAADIRENYSIHNLRIVFEQGEYSFAQLPDGTMLIPDGALYVTAPDFTVKDALTLPERPADVLLSAVDPSLVYITARTGLYAMRV